MPGKAASVKAARLIRINVSDALLSRLAKRAVQEKCPGEKYQ